MRPSPHVPIRGESYRDSQDFKREVPEKRRNLLHRPHNGSVGTFMLLPEEIEAGREIRPIETKVPVIMHIRRLLHRRVKAGIVEVVETQPGQKVSDVFILRFYTLIATHFAPDRRSRSFHSMYPNTGIDHSLPVQSSRNRNIVVTAPGLSNVPIDSQSGTNSSSSFTASSML